MEPDRFKRRTDYSRQPRRPVGPPPVVGAEDKPSQQITNPTPSTPPVVSVENIAPTSSAQPQASAAPPQPVWSQPRQATQSIVAPIAPSTNTAAPTASAPTTIAVNISLPKFHRPHMPKLPYKRIFRWAIVGVVILVVILGIVMVAKHFIHEAPQAAIGTEHVQVVAKPTFTPVAPSSKSNLASVGTKNTGFDGSKNTYSYTDSIAGTTFTVSQQPLPNGFANPQAAVDKIAQGIGGKTALNIPNGTKGYLSSDSKSGDQVIVFTLHNLLIFIQSPFTHSSNDWQLYIASLQ